MKIVWTEIVPGRIVYDHHEGIDLLILTLTMMIMIRMVVVIEMHE
jgi:hypothetical protein